MKKKKLSLLIIINTLIKIVYIRVRRGKWPVPEITPDELFDSINSNQSPVLIYVLRIVGEEGLIPDIIYLPTMKLISSLDSLQSLKDEKIVTVCGGGGMSLVAADILIQEGFKDVKSLNGGMDLWFKRGYPTTKSQN